MGRVELRNKLYSGREGKSISTNIFHKYLSLIADTETRYFYGISNNACNVFLNDTLLVFFQAFREEKFKLYYHHNAIAQKSLLFKCRHCCWCYAKHILMHNFKRSSGGYAKQLSK